MKETYYSSKVLYHKDTPEWTLDSEGCYRDEKGFYIIASDDLAKGTVTKISKGLAKVYDTGVGESNCIDLYVAW